MADFTAANQMPTPGAFGRIEKELGPVVPHPLALNLLQNCDLPPPVKLFSGPGRAFLSSTSKNYGVREFEEEEQLRLYRDCDDRMEILKALRLSQTRARQAERKLRVLSKEKEAISNLLTDECLQLSAHRHWVSLLEFQLSRLQRQQQEETRQRQSPRGLPISAGKMSNEEGSGEGNGSKGWFGAITICLAIAGVGLAFSCRHLF